MPPLAEACLTAQFVATTAMAGVIWFVQLVTYPQFLEVGRETFRGYHRRYTGRVTRVVAPLMIVELVTAAATVALAWSTPLLPLALVGIAAAGGLWLLTALVQVPQHRRLERGYDEATIRRLVAGNWARTALWTLRAPLAWVLATSPAMTGAG